MDLQLRESVVMEGAHAHDQQAKSQPSDGYAQQTKIWMRNPHAADIRRWKHITSANDLVKQIEREVRWHVYIIRFWSSKMKYRESQMTLVLHV